MERNRHILLGLIGLLVLLMEATGCAKKCQKAPEQGFKSITESEWRLVETNDSNQAFRKLNNTTFLIFSFAKNYTGAVNNVVNNDKFDNPIRTFRYNIAPSDSLIRIKYELPPADDSDSSDTSGGGSTQTDPSAPITYNYELKRELTLTNTANGVYYRFVPFTGIVDPDNECTF